MCYSHFEGKCHGEESRPTARIDVQRRRKTDATRGETRQEARQDGTRPEWRTAN